MTFRARHCVLLFALLSFGASLGAATVTWSGAASGQWSVPANWAGGVAPSPGDDLVFGNAFGDQLVNDYPAGTSFHSLTFVTQRSYAISGNALVLGAGGVTGPASSFFLAFQMPVRLPQPQTWTGKHIFVSSLELAAGPITLRWTGGDLNGTFLGSGGMVCIGSFSGIAPVAMNHTGPTFIGNTVRLSLQAMDVASPITIGTGGTIAFMNSGEVVLQAPFTVRSGGTIIGGISNKFVAMAPVSLAGNLTLAGPLPPGTTLTVIENRSGQAVTGTFDGLPEGATFPIGSIVYRISYAAGSSGRDVAVTALPGPAVTLTASPTTLTYGTPVTLTATTSPIATGTITFSPGGTVLLDSNGTAVVTTTAFGWSIQTASARFNGNETQSASTSAPVTLTVTPPGTSFDLIASTLYAPGTILIPDGVQLEASLMRVPLDIPQGTVTFYEGATPLGTVALSTFFVTDVAWGSSARLAVTGLAPGKHVFNAIWTPADPAQPPKQSGTAELIVLQPTSTSLSVTPASVHEGEPVTFTAHVSPGATGVVVLGGLGTLIPLNGSGEATITLSNLTPGTYSVTAAYRGDATHGSSVSSAVPVIVAAAPQEAAAANVPALDLRGLVALCALLVFAATIRLRGAA